MFSLRTAALRRLASPVCHSPLAIARHPFLSFRSLSPIVRPVQKLPCRLIAAPLSTAAQPGQTAASPASPSAPSAPTAPASPASPAPPAAEISRAKKFHKLLMDNKYSRLVRLDLSIFCGGGAAFGFMLAAASPSLPGIFTLPLAGAVAGTVLLSFAGTIYNQIREMPFDKLMARTMNRPLITNNPSEKIEVPLAKKYAGLFTVLGTGLLTISSGGGIVAPAIGLFTLFSYVNIYTPAKRVTMLNTEVGALIGALPVLMGAACGWQIPLDSVLALEFPALSWQIWTGYLFMALWQIPHFMLISFAHREDYYRAGFQMLSNLDVERLRKNANAKWFQLRSPMYGFFISCLLVVLPSLVVFHMSESSPFFVLTGTALSTWYAAKYSKYMKAPRTVGKKPQGATYIFFLAFLTLIVVHSPALSTSHWIQQIESYCPKPVHLQEYITEIGKRIRCFLKGEKFCPVIVVDKNSTKTSVENGKSASGEEK